MEIAGLHGPIVIGGVGGSGTRVVAEIVAMFGTYLGADLNKACDNLTYTLLFRRPRWFYRNRHDRRQIATGIALFRKLMLRDATISAREIAFLMRAVISVAAFGHTSPQVGEKPGQGNGKGLWPMERLQRLRRVESGVAPGISHWGWKEPNSHLLIENLAEQFPGFRYIHTIRHGLDMAFSKNQLQLYSWGRMFGVALPADPALEPRASLKYWIAANQRVLDLRDRIGHDRLLVINFDRLCLEPEAQIRNLMRFLDMKVEADAYRQALRLPRKPSSLGRYRSEDLGQFDAGDLGQLSKFGFSVQQDGAPGD
jgi:hypothetical protein